MISTANPKKKQRVGCSSRLSSSPDADLPKSPEGTVTEPLRPILCAFNDSLTADVILRLFLDKSPSFDYDPAVDQPYLDLHLHSHALRRSKYFATLLSDRWHPDRESDGLFRLNLKIPTSAGSMEPHLTVLQLLYSTDFSDVILSASIALSILPVALELLFDDCIKACVRFLEAVPWSEEEEKAVLDIIPSLGLDESQELLARVSPPGSDSPEEMLHKLITASIGNHPCVASAKVKAFAAKMLRDFPSRESVRRVFDRAFDASLKTVKESLEKYSSPDFRGDHDETEAIQRLNLHTAVYHGKNLLWLVERMIELKVADTAVKQWSDQTAFVADLQRAFQDDAWRNIAPGLPALVLRCTGRFADAVATGSLLAARQIRLKLVSVWLPVLIVCREKNVSPIPSGQKQLYQELEETFLRIISTLPMSDAELLLHHCLSFATRNVEDCPHLVSAFNTWFRRATQPPDLTG
ncbi:BTB/POZ domain-containing protein At3g05675-like [Aristolochia californica]|uniref:BTB/POZ domain-containing protein At3g05675-like n=1 Tax=Aristolochia californica TaxID=171875 RepID=UPI0035E1091B